MFASTGPYPDPSKQQSGSVARGSTGLRLVVLAGQGGRDPDGLAARFAVSHKCLVPLAGKPLVAHVLGTAAAHPLVASLAVCIEPEAFDPIWDVLTRLPGRGSVKLVEARPSIAQSVRAAVEAWDGPVIVTTADHALLSSEAIDAVVAALDHADAALALVPRDAVLAAHPEGKRHFLAFADGEFANCNLYGMSGPAALGALDPFRQPGQIAHAGARVGRAIGLVTWLGVRFRLLTLTGALERIAKRLKLQIAPVILADGRQAIDLDDEHSYAVVSQLLGREMAEIPEIRARAAG